MITENYDMKEFDEETYMQEREVVKHWKYFLSLEKKLKETEDYVYHGISVLDDRIELINGCVYSNVFKQLILLTGAEFESLSREMLGIKKGNIGTIIRSFIDKFPKMIDLEIYTDYVSIKPMADFHLSGENGYGLRWWSSYNKLKHGGEKYFNLATLDNCILSLASLYIVNLYNIESTTGELYLARETQYFRCEYTPGYVTGFKGSLPDFKDRTRKDAEDEFFNNAKIIRKKESK